MDVGIAQAFQVCGGTLGELFDDLNRIDLAIVLDHCPADVGILPTGWDNRHDLLESFLERQVEPRKDLFHLVQAVEFLGAFSKGGQQLFDVAVSHGV